MTGYTKGCEQRPSDMQANEKAPTELQRILRMGRSGLITVGVFSLFINLLMLVQPFYMLQIFDRVLRSQSMETLVFLTLIVFGLFVLMGVLQFIRSRILVRLGVQLDQSVSGRLFESMFRSSLSRPGTESAQALDDMTSFRQFLTGPGVIALFDVPWMPIYLAIMFLFHPLLGWYGVACTLIVGALSYANEAVTRTPLAMANQANRQARRFASNNVRNAEVIHAMGMQPNIRRRWLQRQGEMIDSQAFASDKAGIFSNASRSVRFMAQAFAYGVGSFLIIRGELSGGMLIAGAILIGRALAPLDQIIGSWRQIAQARIAYGRLEQLFEQFPHEPQRLTLPTPVGHLQVDKLMAAPAGSRTPILRSISFNLEAGDSLGIIGPSGAGKSSLARAILGVWPLLNGVVRLDGADMRQYNREEVGPHIGYLPQDIELFDGTVAENIARFGDKDDDAVVKAAKRSGAHDLIVRLPNGYDTPVGVSGGTLSAGQRQRIGLARALYGGPALVVLDEPNSNLDDVGEIALSEALKDLHDAGTTVIVITHKRNVLAQLQKLMILRNGQITGFGGRDDVLAKIHPNQKAATSNHLADDRPASDKNDGQAGDKS
jgi:ATP-binding cassette subfamily C protein EexD